MNDNFIVQYAVSDKSEGNAWDSMARWACNIVGHDSGWLHAQDSNAYLKGKFVEKEREFKEVADQPLPSRYRSAKSVILKAIKWGILPMDGDEVLGKSAVEQTVKTHLESTISTDWEQKVQTSINKMLETLAAATSNGIDAGGILTKRLSDAGYL